MATTTCLPTTESSSSLASPALLHRPIPSSFVQRDGTKLTLDGQPFSAVGPNIYWLGLDENVVPNPSYPTRGRVTEMMGVASAMGATTIRSTSLGVSVGNALSVMPAKNTTNQEAFQAIDWAVYAAGVYGLRLIIPLCDQYDYYHGGIPSFLRFSSLPFKNPSVDYLPFYNLSSPVYADFVYYVTALLTHRSTITNLTLAESPTIFAFETGNELGGYALTGLRPPVAWTTAIAQLIKKLSTNTRNITTTPAPLIMSGTYGIVPEELVIPEVDLYSNHFYPPSEIVLLSSAAGVTAANKVFIAGEYDWTDPMYSQKPYIYIAVIAPVIIAALVFLLPGRWWPWRIVPFGVGKRLRKRRDRTDSATNDPSFEYTDEALPSPVPCSETVNKDGDTAVERQGGFLLRRWHFSLLLIIIFCPIVFAIIYCVVPAGDPLSTFLSEMEQLGAKNQLGGSFYWSLFGRDSTACSYVTHNDGFTLHYPSAPGSSGAGAGSGDVVRSLTNHALRMSGRGASTYTGFKDLLSVTGLQKPLTVPLGSNFTL